MLGPREPVRVLAPVGEFLKLDTGFEPYNEVAGRVGRECFHVEEEWLKRLKSLLFQKSGLSFTTFEALGAFIWRAKVGASRIQSEEQVKFAYSNQHQETTKSTITGWVLGQWSRRHVCLAHSQRINRAATIEDSRVDKAD